jgi:hypothetical protein
MRVIIFLMLQLFVITVWGQIPGWTSLKVFAGKSVDQGTAIHIDKNNNYYIVGTFNNVSAFGTDSLIIDCKGIPPPQTNAINGFLLRFDSTKTLNLTLAVSNGLLGETVVDDNGNIIVSGAINFGATRDGFIRKYDTSGSILWTKFVQSISNSGGSADDVITSIDVSKDGSLVVSGFTYGEQVSVFGSFIAGPSNFVAKVSNQGNVSWIHHFSSTLGLGVYKVKFDYNGDVILTGNERDIATNQVKGLIGKISGTSGNGIWKKSFLSSGNFTPWIRSVGTYKNSYMFGGEFGGQLTVGDSLFVSSGNLDIVLIKTDTAGNLIWTKKAGSPGRDKLYNLVCDTNAVTYMTGGYSDGFKYNNIINLPSKGNTDVYVLALDSLGNIIWEKHGGSNIPGNTNDLFYDEYGASISLDTKKQVHIVGTTRGSGNFGTLVFSAPEEAMQNAFWLTLGKIQMIDTINYPCTKPTTNNNASFSIIIFPNPFTQSLFVENSEQKVVSYQFSLTNTLGQRIFSKEITGSKIKFDEWNTLAKGIYLLTISVGEYKKTFKLVKG